jgi:hypothetical protein
VVEHVAAGVVLVVGHEELVAELEAERTKHGVDASRRVGHEHQIFRPRPDEAAQDSACLVEQTLEIAQEELHGVLLHALSEGALCVEHRSRRRTERAVVEEDDVRVERPDHRRFSVT